MLAVRAFFAVLISGISIILLANPASAYSGYDAAIYANTYAITPHAGAYPYFEDDCTNFVSQAVHAGGFSTVNPGQNPQDNRNWWVAKSTFSTSGFNWSLAWSVSLDYRNFLQYDTPGGISEGTAPGYSRPSYTPAYVGQGDVLFYNWSGKNDFRGIAHSAIQVGTITDPDSKLYGDVVDQHSNNRKWAFWSLEPYNSQRASTIIYFYRIDRSNH